MSVTEWLKTGERLRAVHEEITDAQIVAQWAAQALTEGRYELGRTLANIAAQAARNEPRLVPMRGQTRDEEPARNAATEILPVQQEVPPNGRCAAIAVPSTGEVCGRVAVWAETPGAIGHTGIWSHLDATWDADHEPDVTLVR